MIDLSSADGSVNIDSDKIATLLKTVNLSIMPELKDYELLRDKIADYYSVARDFVVLGNGSDDLIERLALLCSGEDALTVVPCFERLYEAPIKYSNKLDTYELNVDNQFKYTETDHALILNKIDKKKYAAVWLCSPNNPTGTLIDLDYIKEIADKLSPGLVIVDESFLNYIVDSDIRSAASLLLNHPNIIVISSFSKAWGLAGLRLGYTVSTPKAALRISRAGVMFAVNTIAVRAASYLLDKPLFTYEQIKRIHSMRHEVVEWLLGDAAYVTITNSPLNVFMVRLKSSLLLHEMLLNEDVKTKSLNRMNGLVDQGFCRIKVPTNEEEIETLLYALARAKDNSITSN